MERGLASLTVNRRLTALRSMIKLGRTLGLVPWTLECQGMKAESYRDTRGPGVNGFRAMLDAPGPSQRRQRPPRPGDPPLFVRSRPATERSGKPGSGGP